MFPTCNCQQEITVGYEVEHFNGMATSMYNFDGRNEIK